MSRGGATESSNKLYSRYFSLLIWSLCWFIILLTFISPILHLPKDDLGLFVVFKSLYLYIPPKIDETQYMNNLYKISNSYQTLLVLTTSLYFEALYCSQYSKVHVSSSITAWLQHNDQRASQIKRCTVKIYKTV